MHQPQTTPRPSIYYDYRVYPFETAPEQRGERRRHPVVIVGAGPIGLTTALQLARHGVASVLVESECQVSEGSRAIVFTRRSMEILQQVGVTERMLETALPWRYGNSIYRGQRVFRMEAPRDADDRFEPMNNLQQQYLEEYLIECAAREPLIDLRWGTRVTAIDNGQDGVRLDVDTPEGPYTIESDWLVSADGARSAVRQLLGLRLEGDSYSGNFVIADIRIDLDLPTERLAFFDPDWNRGNTILMHREPGGIWRLDYQLPDGESPERALAPEELKRCIQAQLDMIGADAPWELDWSSVYSARALTLPDYVHGRVLFTGDAAHLLPIFGVRGANTGLQDCQNLAWKLAYVVRGLAGRELLQSYSHERVAAAWEIIAEAGKSTRFMTPPSRGFRLLRDAVLSLSLSESFVGPLFHWRTSRPHDYADSPLNAHADDNDAFSTGPANGTPLQNLRFGDDDYLFDRLPSGFCLLYFTDAPTLPAELSAQAEALVAAGLPFSVVTISRTGEHRPAQSTFADPHGKAFEKYGAEAGSAYLVRPDQHVCGRWQSLDIDALPRLLERALLQQEEN